MKIEVNGLNVKVKKYPKELTIEFNNNHELQEFLMLLVFTEVKY